MKPSSQSPQFPQTAIRIALYLLVLLPAVFGFLFVRWFGVNVIYGDSLSMVNPFLKLSTGALGVADLFMLHNQHWILFPEVAMLSLGTLTQWNSVAEMYLSQVSLLGTLILLLLAFRSSTKSRSVFLPLLMIPISLMVFSFAQYENMLKGFQITFTFTEFFGVVALFSLHAMRNETRRRVVFVAAIAGAVVASFSTAAGLTVWLAGLLQLSLTPMDRATKRVYLAVWGLGTVGIWVTYLVARAGQGRDTGSMLSALGQPVVAAEYFFRLLGSPLFGNRPAFTAGVFLVCLTVVTLLVVFRSGRDLSEYSFWISLLFWSFLILASVVAGRFAMGTGLAVAPRYTSFSILTIVSIYGLLATAILGIRLNIRRPSIGILVFVLMSGVVLWSAADAYPYGYRMGSLEKETRVRAAAVLVTYESRSDAVLEKHFLKPGERIRTSATVIERLGLNVFSEASDRRSREARRVGSRAA